MKKLKAARDRKSAEQGRRIEGRKSYREINPELIRVAERLVHGNRKERLSLRGVSSNLAEMGHLTGQSTRFSATQIKRLLKVYLKSVDVRFELPERACGRMAFRVSF